MKLSMAMLMMFLVTTCAHKPNAPRALFRIEYRAISIHNGQLGVGEELAREYFVELPKGTSLLGTLVATAEDGAPLTEAKNENLNAKHMINVVDNADDLRLDTSVDFVLPSGQVIGEFSSQVKLTNALAGAVGGWAFIAAKKGDKSPPAVLIIVKAERLKQ